jgi:hypothetical protein
LISDATYFFFYWLVWSFSDQLPQVEYLSEAQANADIAAVARSLANENFPKKPPVRYIDNGDDKCFGIAAIHMLAGCPVLLEALAQARPTVDSRLYLFRSVLLEWHAVFVAALAAPSPKSLSQLEVLRGEMLFLLCLSCCCSPCYDDET